MRACTEQLIFVLQVTIKKPTIVKNIISYHK